MTIDMKQEEKSRRSYEKIIQAGIAEFGEKSYEQVSLNTVCAQNQIAKGLFYHHFKGKDALYLACVERCFRELTAYLQSFPYDSPDFRENLKKLLQLRSGFFEEHPDYSNIFFCAVLRPPKHLQEQIKIAKQSFDRFQTERYRELLQQITLRDGITEEMAMDYFFTFQEMFNYHFQNRAQQHGETFDVVITDHEKQLSDMLSVILYGIAREDIE